MPTYEYECERGHVSERFFSHPDDAPREITCYCNYPPISRACCAKTATRIISGGAGFITKGDGFHDSGRMG